MRLSYGLILLGALFAWQYRVEIRAWVDPPPPISASAGEVTLYATEWCGYCQQTREILERRGVPYREFDVEKSAEGMARFQQLKGRGVPVLVIGDEVIHGFNKSAMDRALREL
jgi:glutaredoxin-like YruB-family protein